MSTRDLYLAHQRSYDAERARFAADTAADHAIALAMTLFETVDRIASTTNESRPAIRADLDALARDTAALRDALKRSSLPWPAVRTAAITRLRTDHGRPMFIAFR